MAKISIVLTLTLVLTTIFSGFQGADAYAAKCKDMDLVAEEKEMMHMNDCLKVVNLAKFEDMKPEHIGCFTKCCMEKMELVDAGGKAHRENINKAIGTLWPDAGLRAQMQDGIGKCLDQEESHLKKDNDPGCVSYEPLATCMHKAFTSICS